MQRIIERLIPHLPLVLPLVVSGVLAVVLGQPLFLLFGLTGPVVGLSQSLVTKQRQKQAERERELEEENTAHSDREKTDRALASWRNEVVAEYPSVGDWLYNPLWRPAGTTHSTKIRVGVGEAVTPREVAGGIVASGVPITIPLCQTVAVIGQGPSTTGLWRSLACQVMAVIAWDEQHQPGRLTSMWPVDSEPPTEVSLLNDQGERVGLWLLVDSADQLPRETTWVITLGVGQSCVIHHRGVAWAVVAVADRVSYAQSRWVRSRLIPRSESPGESSEIVRDFRDPHHLYADLAGPGTTVDLVAQGPHVLVWGKTGSGKSVLIQRLLAELVASYPADFFSFVGIDFKGGATLGPLTTLPHCRGLLTDLAPGLATRVTKSLKSEMRAREQLCGSAGVATWAELPAAMQGPRIVIVVDEAGTVATQAPELMEVLTDIAQRGRSLGLHLLFSTQRPQQLPRAVVANCALRWCLGVTDAEEAAQYLPDAPRHLIKTLVGAPAGTVLTPGVDGPVLVRPTPLEVLEPAGFSPPSATSAPLWLEPLPSMIAFPEVECGEATDGYLLGVADVAEHQRREQVRWEPCREGPLIIVGEAQTGHTTALTLLQRQAEGWGVSVVSSPGRLDAWCDQLIRLCDEGANPTSTLVLVDRLDLLLAGATPQTEAWVAEHLTHVSSAVSRLGQGSGIVVTVTPGSPALSGLSRWSSTRCLFRHRLLDQWSTGGGERELFDSGLPPGRGVINGVLVQWVVPPEIPTSSTQHGSVDKVPDGVVVVWGGEGGSGEYPGMSVQQAEASHREISEALVSPGVVFADVSPHHMRQIIGPGYDYPPVAAHAPYGWWVTTGGIRLVNLER